MAVEAHLPQRHDPFQPPTKPLEQALPDAAQIPLQAFELPDFPPEAAHLKELTLTSDIKPTEYADLLAKALPENAVPKSIPKGIELLTLELFSLGYPPSFLTSLSQELPRLKALTLYCHLIDGVSDASRKDAGEFMYNILTGNKENEGGLRELHLLDIFCRRGFLAGLGSILEELESSTSSDSSAAMRFLEVSYTYRGHSDPGFLSRIPGDELPLMLISSLIAASFRLSPAPSEQDNATGLSEQLPDDPAHVDADGNRIPGQKPQGIIPLSSAHPGTTLLVERLTRVARNTKEPETVRSGKGPQALKMLDCTLYTLTLDQLTLVINHQTELAVLSASVLVRTDEHAKKSLLHTIQSGSQALETVELVGVPEEKLEEVSLPSSMNDTTKLTILESLPLCFPRYFPHGIRNGSLVR